MDVMNAKRRIAQTLFAENDAAIAVYKVRGQIGLNYFYLLFLFFASMRHRIMTDQFDVNVVWSDHAIAIAF